MTNDDFYRKLRQKVTNWAQDSSGKDSLVVKYLLLAPDFFNLLCKLAIDKDVPAKSKLKIIAAISYFITPFDLIPDFLFMIGFLDDIVVAAYVLKIISEETRPETLNKYWNGKRDVVDVVDDINKCADKLIGKNFFKQIRVLFKEPMTDKE